MLQDPTFSFVADFQGAAVAVAVATATPQRQPAADVSADDSDPSGSRRDHIRRGVRLECVAAHPELQEREEVVCCLLHFLLQLLHTPLLEPAT